MKITFIRSTTVGFALLLAGLLFCGCENISLSQMAASTGYVTRDQAAAIERGGRAVAKTFKDITPEQEYYIGRAVGATVTTKYSVYDSEGATRYINLLGQTLAQASDKPETFGGYHFLILDTDEINAFAAPGGLIFVSKGMIRCCKDEDDLAAVLAHEIGHVQNEDALRSIKGSRLTSALTIVGTEAAKTLGSRELAQLTEDFEDSITDITSTMVNSGYSRRQERQADAAAVVILERVGYNPHALVRMLTEMKTRLKPGGRDFAKTHPDPVDRIKDIKPLIKDVPDTPAPNVRKERFRAALGAI